MATSFVNLWGKDVRFFPPDSTAIEGGLQYKIDVDTTTTVTKRRIKIILTLVTLLKITCPSMLRTAAHTIPAFPHQTNFDIQPASDQDWRFNFQIKFTLLKPEYA